MMADDREKLFAHLDAMKAREQRTSNVRRMVANDALHDLDASGTLAERAHLIDWGEFWKREHIDQEWLAPPLFPKGRLSVVYAPAKAGKSEIVCAVIFALVTGRPIFGRHPVEPADVLYLDYEMSEDDLYERLTDHGYGPGDDLSHLHWASLPSLPPLDTDKGANAVLDLVELVGATVVVIDTFGRAVEGDENENDTVRAFWRHTGLALKAAGITVIRTDHAGKDLSRGQRGGSAKADDPDVVWCLKRVEGGCELTRTHTRISWVAEKVELTRLEDDDGRISYKFNEAGTVYPEGTGPLAKIMDGLDLPIAVTFKVAHEALKAVDQSKRKQLVLAAIRWRQQEAESRFGSGLAVSIEGEHMIENPSKTAGNRAGNRLLEPISGTNGNQNTKAQVDDSEPRREPLGTDAHGKWEPGGVTDKEPPGPNRTGDGLEVDESELF